MLSRAPRAGQAPADRADREHKVLHGPAENMAAVKQLYRSASVVSADRVVFNIKGNDYRLVTAMDFEKRIVWVEWIGTHSEYDRIDVKTVAYERPKTDPE